MTLCESLLIDPRTGDVLDINFNPDTFQLHHETFDYIKSNLDLLSYKDPASKQCNYRNVCDSLTLIHDCCRIYYDKIVQTIIIAATINQ